LRLRAAVIAGVLLLAGCTPSPAPNPVAEIESGVVSLYEQVIIWEDCEDGFECAVVAAPLDWRTPDGLLIAVALMRKAGTSSLEPLLVNPGGPGSSSIEWLLASYESLGSDYLRSNFQVIAFDPRGLGRPHRSSAATWVSKISFSMETLPTDLEPKRTFSIRLTCRIALHRAAKGK